LGNGFHKYNAQRVSSGGHWYDSRLEKSVHDMLLLMEKAGEVTEVQVKHQVTLLQSRGKRIRLNVDYSVLNTKTGETEFYEAKGYQTAEWKMKRSLWAYGFGPGLLHVWGGSSVRLQFIETIDPKEGEYYEKLNLQKF